MATGFRLHPALLIAVLGAAISFGVGAALPVRGVFTPRQRYHTRDGPLWDAAAGAVAYVEVSGTVTPWQWWLETGFAAAMVLAFGAVAGLLCRAAWECLRSACWPPT